MRKGILVGIILVISLIFYSVEVTTTSTSMTIVEHPESILSDYTVHDPIVITSDSDFESQDWLGNGTESDPYIIENLWISQTEVGMTSIDIRFTTAFFSVQNCYLDTIFSADPYSADCIGIYLEYTGNGTISNNTITGYKFGVWSNTGGINLLIDSNNVVNCHFGIATYGSKENMTIINNQLQECVEGIYAIHNQPAAVNITNNYIIDSGSAAIRIRGSNNSLIQNNFCVNGQYESIYLGAFCYNTLVVNNTIKGMNTAGIFLEFRSANNTIIWNTIIEGQSKFALDDGVNNTFCYNYWSDYEGYDNNNDGFGDTPYIITGTAGSVDNYPRAPMYYHDPILMTSDDDFETQGWPGNGTAEIPYVISNLLIIDSRYGGGQWHTIHILNIRAHFIVRDCILTRTDYRIWSGICLDNTTNGIVERNRISDSDTGIFLLNGCENNTIRDNDIPDYSDSGIYIDQSNHNLIVGNNCSAGEYGVSVMGTNSSEIHNNTLINSGEASIRMITCRDVSILNNVLYSRFNYAIHLETVVNALVRNNTCESGAFYSHWMTFGIIEYNSIPAAETVADALEVVYCDDNTFMWNAFRDDVRESNGERNLFNCNYYSAYSGVDDNGDEIGDTPHSVNGIYDNHPLMYQPAGPDTLGPYVVGNPATNPLEPSSEDMVDVSVHIIDHSGIDSVILSYFDGTQWNNASMSWNTSMFEYTVPTLPNGIHVTYRFYSNDSLGNWFVSTDYSYDVYDVPTTTTTVTNGTTSGDQFPIVMVISLIGGACGIGVIVIVIIVIKKKD